MVPDSSDAEEGSVLKLISGAVAWVKESSAPTYVLDDTGSAFATAGQSFIYKIKIPPSSVTTTGDRMLNTMPIWVDAHPNADFGGNGTSTVDRILGRLDEFDPNGTAYHTTTFISVRAQVGKTTCFALRKSGPTVPGYPAPSEQDYGSFPCTVYKLEMP